MEQQSSINSQRLRREASRLPLEGAGVPLASVSTRTGVPRTTRFGLTHPRGTLRPLRAALRAFRREEHGWVAIEGAIALVILVVGFAGLMHIVSASYENDRMGRAARAAARALALDRHVGACTAIRRELRLPEDFDCATQWTLTVDLGVSPDDLPAELDQSVTAGSGDMVLVRIGWNRTQWSAGGLIRDANAADAATIPVVAIGLARCEEAGCS